MTEGRLSDYVSGRLSAAERARLERAVQECALCRDELESLQQTRALLQALPGEPLPRSFVFSEAPAPAESEVHRTAQAPAFRMPGWAYAGAAAVAGVAALVFVLSGAAGAWLAQEGGDEFGGVASTASISTASMEMAQAESIPAPAAVPESVERARPAAQSAPAMEQSMAAAPSSSALLPAPMEDSAGRREGGADVVAEGEVAKEVEQEVVVEGILESGIEPTPGAEAYAGAAESAAGPEMAAEPQLAAMAEAPAPTAAPAAAEGQERGAIEAIAGSPASAEAISPGATAGRADSSAPAPTVKAETDAARSTTMDGVQAAAAEVAETPTSTPVVQSAVLAPPALGVTATPAAALAATREPEESPAKPLPKTTPQAATPEPAMTDPTPARGATEKPPATPEPALPAPTVAAIGRVAVMPEPITEPPAPELERGMTGAQGPAGASGSAGPAGAASAVEPDAADGAEIEARELSEGSGEQSAGLSVSELVLAAVIALAAAVMVVVAIFLVKRLRSRSRIGG